MVKSRSSLHVIQVSGKERTYLHFYFVNGVEYNSHMVEDTAFSYLKFFVLLYADDTVILAENADVLSKALKVYKLQHLESNN